MTDAALTNSAIAEGRTALGIEFGSTRIKAVLTGPDHEVLAIGTHDWENQFVDRTWTYSLEAVEGGLQSAWADLAGRVRQRFGQELRTVGSMGISAMMHGYLAFDADDTLLVPFRTWRNTTTGEAAAELTELFSYHIPLRWSIAHLYQAILNGESHVRRIAHLTTLAGYVHWRLTGQRVLGVGDASGMFPVDPTTGGFHQSHLGAFGNLIADRDLGWSLPDLLPTVLHAGGAAGVLSEEGAVLLDPSGTLRPGVLLCPPEGDAGTGMVATNSVARRTGNVSAGTSIFAMVVLEGELSRLRTELDLVTTPAGDLVAMVHCNNGASELDAWAGVFTEFAHAIGAKADRSAVFETLFGAALAGEADAGGLLAYNYLSGEHIPGLEEGRPLLLRTPEARFSLANLMRAQLLSSLATLRLGMEVLLREEGVRLDRLFAHGGLFSTKGVAQRLLAAAVDAPVSVGDTAAEGGAWGIAVLAAYAESGSPLSLADYLDQEVFVDLDLQTTDPDPLDVAGFEAFGQRWARGLAIERAAVANS